MKEFVKKYKYEVMFMVTLMMYLIYYIPALSEVTHWTITPYALSYRLGFISRGFIGSLLRLVIPNLTIKIIYLFIFVNILLFCGLTLYFMHKILWKAYDDSRNGLIFLLALFLVNPGSIAFLFYWGNYGRFDMYLLVCLILIALMVIYDRLIWLAPLMCVCAVLTHQAFVFQYFPAVLILLFYSAFILKRKYGKSIFVVTLLTTCVAFLYMQFFSHINYSYEETLAIIDATTDLPRCYFTADMMIRVEYYMSVIDTFGPLVKIPFPNNVIKSVTIFVFLIPMIRILVNLWKCFCRAHKNILCKLMPWFVLIAEIPMFVLTCDYGRDYAAIIICNFILIFTLYVLGDEGMKEGVRRLTEDIKAHVEYYIFVLVLCAGLGKFTASDIIDIGDHAYRLFESIFL
ncbi:MAG: hypothetical protein ACI4AQ_11085 [Lachnospiraceae bacterium]